MSRTDNYAEVSISKAIKKHSTRNNLCLHGGDAKTLQVSLQSKLQKNMFNIVLVQESLELCQIMVCLHGHSPLYAGHMQKYSEDKNSHTRETGR